MNINRLNYENFFLLYIDNELSAQERNAVEVFAEENADLKAELQILQQTVFNTDDIVFENKQGLLKDEMASLKERLILYLDNELNAADTLKTAEVLKVDKTAQKEFALLQRTQVQADATIIFTNKKSLYKKEEGRVVPLAWWRIAAAAILLGVGVWGTITLVNKNKINNGTEMAGSTIPVIKSTTSTIANITSNSVQPALQRNKNINTITVAVKTNATAGNKPNDKQPSIKNIHQELPQESNTTAAKEETIKKPGNNLPAPDYNNFNNNDRNKTLIASVTPQEKAIEKVNPGTASTAASSNNINTDNGYALNTQFAQSNAEELNNDKVLYMDENNVKKSKLGGFLRKVKRLVERNTNIKTGDGIKVAGFDIAIK